MRGFEKKPLAADSHSDESDTATVPPFLGAGLPAPSLIFGAALREPGPAVPTGAAPMTRSKLLA